MTPSQENHTDQSAGSPSSITRRQLIKGATALGLSAAVLGPLLAACTRVENTMTVTPVPTFPPTPAATPIPAPTFAPRPSPTATFQPTATPAPVSQPTATPFPTPVPKAATIFEADTSNLTDRQKVSHVLRRAGFGYSKSDLDRAESIGLKATINELVDFESVDDSALTKRIGDAGLDFELRSELRRWWFLRMAYTKRPLPEKIALFWHGILTSGLKKVGDNYAMIDQNNLLKDRGMGSYNELLKEIGRDPAMLIWLDSRLNKKKAPNENYARELMELFTLSPGYYTEEDVRESARAFTGWGTKGQKDKGIHFLFRTGQHDNGTKVFLGEEGNFDGDDVVDIILRQPQAARFITTKLWEFFAYTDPEPRIIDHLSEVFITSDYVIRDVVRALLQMPDFYSQKAYRTQIKSPIDLVVQTVRAMGFDDNGKRFTRVPDAMGQTLFDPPDVAGWPGGEAWINSSSMLQRANFANSVALWMSQINSEGVSLPDRDELMNLLLDGVPDPAMEAALDYFEAETKGEDSFGIQRAILYLFLAGPALQRG
jgi:uncharacterized protein (DUF1800 family)